MIRFSGYKFNAPEVIAALEKTTYKAMLRFGQYVRKVAQHSLKQMPEGKYSKPGEIPFSHSGKLKEHTYYGWDPSTRSVVIGPGLLVGSGNIGVKGPSTIPEALEHGGFEMDSRGTRTYEERPFMGPAFEIGVERLETFWSIT